MPGQNKTKQNGGKKGAPDRGVRNQKQKPAKARKPRKTNYGEYMRLAGQAIGAASGLPMGGLVGSMAGMGLSRITGHGDYSIKGNSITKDTIVGDVVPSFKVVGNETRVCHRELIGNVVSGGPGFLNTGFRVNAGNSEVFPWLSNIARRFQKYKFDGLVFVFKTRSSEYSAAAGMGTVIMASNYNSGDQNYTTVQQMDNSAFAVSCKPSQSLVHPVECAVRDRAREWYFVRDGVNVAVAPQDFDMLIFQLATSGLSASSGQVIGELWVTYDVVLTESCIPPEAPSEVTPVGSLWEVPIESGYNSSFTTYKSGGVFTNNTTRGEKAYTIALLSSGPGYVKPLWLYSEVNPTLGTSNSLMVWPTPSVAKADTANTSNKVWFTRNGTYELAVDWVVTSAQPQFALFTITGNGASAVESWGETAIAGGSHRFVIRVVGVNPSTPDVELPWVNFAGANNQTFQTSTWQFSILA